MQVFAITLGCTLELDDKNFLVKALHILTMGQRKVKNGTELKNPLFWLVFTVPVGYAPS